LQYDDLAHQSLEDACDSINNTLSADADADVAGFATIRKLAELSRAKDMASGTSSASDDDGEHDQCVSYADYVDYMKNMGPKDRNAFIRGWIWQTCNEFGFYQSTDRGYNIFESALPVK
jgi:Serine carboxypeptidase S28